MKVSSFRWPGPASLLGKSGLQPALQSWLQSVNELLSFRNHLRRTELVVVALLSTSRRSSFPCIWVSSGNGAKLVRCCLVFSFILRKIAEPCAEHTNLNYDRFDAVLFTDQGSSFFCP